MVESESESFVFVTRVRVRVAKNVTRVRLESKSESRVIQPWYLARYSNTFEFLRILIFYEESKHKLHLHVPKPIIIIFPCDFRAINNNSVPSYNLRKPDRQWCLISRLDKFTRRIRIMVPSKLRTYPDTSSTNNGVLGTDSNMVVYEPW